MKKKYTRALCSATIMSLILTAALPVASTKAAAGQVTRVGESDSYQTAATVATTNWTSSKDVVLVCGEGYADAVSGTVLAKKLDAPILLTTAGSLNSSAKTALDKLKPQNIYVIGGTASISQTLRDSLKNTNYNLVELGGKNRYETNLAVANQLIKLGVSADNVMLVSGEGFSDVLSATSVAATKNQILLLGNNNPNSMKPVLDFIKANNSSVTVVGTKNSINDSMYEALGAVKRVNGGADRFETNLNVLNEFKDNLKTDKLFIANASGNRYADALIASSLAGKWNAPLIIVDDDTSSATNKAVDYIKSKVNSSTDLNFIGGSEFASDTLVSKINSAVPVVNEPTVKSVSANGLNQIKVVFNTTVDKNTAEILSNYKIDGASFTGSATLQDDNRTVAITLTTPFAQYKSVNFTVNNSILDKSQNNTIGKFEKNITFSDIAAPKLESVTARGGNKLVVKFSEPIRISTSDLSAMKINRQSIANFGLNTTMTVLRDKSDVWADGVELYFNSPLPLGNNTFSIPNGDIGKRFDSAGKFPIKVTSVNFYVDSASGTPQVKSVTYDTAGAIYVTYDRAMDKQTALEDSNYTLNGSIISVNSSNINFVEGSNDSVVKIEGISNLIKNGENKVVVSFNVKDTYGNEIEESVIKLNNENASFKPQITNISIIDGKTIRIKFSKEVLYNYATNKFNYKIVDSDGADITYKVNNVQSVSDSNGNYNRIYDIKFKDSAALGGSKYTLTIKNIIDLASTPNVMDTYTTDLIGLNNEAPNVTSIVKRIDNDQEVIIFFNKAMNETSITNSANYYFVDGNGQNKNLPSSASLYPGIDDKSVIIDFPSNFIIGNGAGERYVIKMGVANVTDKDGVLLNEIAYNDTISTNYSGGPDIIYGASKLTFEGNDIKVKVALNAPLDILNISDFAVGGKTPDSGTMIGNDVILTFKGGINKNEKINAIKSSGDSVQLNIYSTSSSDVAGRKLKSSWDTLLIPPVTVPESWTADINNSSGTNPSVTIVFNQNIDDDIITTYNDDFVFTNERTGEKLNVLSATINGKNVTYKFNYGTVKAGDHIDVHANSDISKINIRSNDHGNGNYSVYTPSSDDLKDRTLNAR